MNKNTNKLDGKRTQGSQMQNQGNWQDGTDLSRGINLNREPESNASESGNKQNTGREKRIHPIEPSVEKNLNRERGKNRLGSTVEKNLVREKKTIVMESRTLQNQHAVNGSPSSRAHAMYDREPVYKSTPFQTSTQNQYIASNLVDELKAPVITGTALYVIAALLLIGWAVGFFYFEAGAAIHVLLMLALVSVLIKVGQGRTY